MTEEKVELVGEDIKGHEYLGEESVNHSEDRKLQAELEMVQQACITEYTKARQLNYLKENASVPENFIGTVVPVSSLPTSVGVTWLLTSSDVTSGYKNYFRLTPSDLEKLSIFNSDYTYIINYYTGEVYNETEIYSSENIPLYIKSVATYQTDNMQDTGNFIDW